MVEKKLQLVISILLFFSVPVFAEQEQELADAIAEVCHFQDENLTEDDKLICMDYYVNCIVGKGGKWEDKDLFRCMKEKNNGHRKRN